MMTPERWQKVRDILEQALELAPEKRGRFLDVACSSDPALRDEVQSLLYANDEAASEFLESPPVRASPLSSGLKLGDYEIVSQIGAGGMGVVYRARDLRLGRPVAIKVLREHLAADPNRLRRFEQEAQSAAALNHPNILAVYQLGVYRGSPYLVSELLEGETLRDKLRQPLSQSHAIDWGEQVAQGLTVAHQRGVIHRDLKPENLYVTAEGRVKILDFGLAKLLEDESNPADTLSTLGFKTNSEMIAGTAAYSSPEQVRGEKLDARTDLFSFGVVLYELATAERPFNGDTPGVLFEAILNREPSPPTEINAGVTPEFERIIAKALEKDREVRYQSAAEIRADLKRLRRDAESGRSAPYRVNRQNKRRSTVDTPRLLWWAGVILLFGGVILGIWLGSGFVKSRIAGLLTGPTANLHAQINPPPMNSFRMTGDSAGPPVISPNGVYVAFTATEKKDGKFKLWVRTLNSVEARALPDTDNSVFPFWSPDSKSLGFFADGKLKTINVTMGYPVVVCEASNGRGGSWSVNGEILFTPTPTAGLLRVNATGGTPQPLTSLQGTTYTTHRWPFFLPDQKHFLYFAASHEPAQSGNNMVFYASLDGRENRPLFHSETNAIFAAGFLLFVTGDSVMSRAFDPIKAELTGEPILLARKAINDSVTWHADVSASDTSILMYGGTGEGSRQLVWLDSITYAQTGVAVDGLSSLFLARLSPQGDRVLMQKDHDGHDISVYDLRDKTATMSLPKTESNAFPIWSPDGKWIAYGSSRNGGYRLMRIAADGSGKQQELLQDDNHILPVDWTGSNLLYMVGRLGNEFDCWSLSFETGRARKLLGNIDDCRLSPDGQWLAYSARDNLTSSTSPDSLNIYVTDFRRQESKHQVSEDSGIGPRWAADGKELYYLEEGILTLVRLTVRFSDGAPHFHLLSRSRPNMLAEPIYDVSRDKKHILVQRIPEPTAVVVTNFAEGLENR